MQNHIDLSSFWKGLGAKEDCLDLILPEGVVVGRKTGFVDVTVCIAIWSYISPFDEDKVRLEVLIEAFQKRLNQWGRYPALILHSEYDEDKKEWRWWVKSETPFTQLRAALIAAIVKLEADNESK